MTEPQIVVRQAAVFGSKHQGDPVGRGRSHDVRSTRPRSSGVVAVQPRATGGADHQSTIGDRGAQRGVHLHGVEHVASVDCHGFRLLATQPGGIDQRQVTDPQVAHRPRHGTDIPRVVGSDENDP